MKKNKTKIIGIALIAAAAAIGIYAASSKKGQPQSGAGENSGSNQSTGNPGETLFDSVEFGKALARQLSVWVMSGMGSKNWSFVYNGIIYDVRTGKKWVA